jgi:hypothetical protein
MVELLIPAGFCPIKPSLNLSATFLAKSIILESLFVICTYPLGISEFPSEIYNPINKPIVVDLKEYDGKIVATYVEE